MNKFILSLTVFFTLFACKGQSEDDQIKKTSSKVLESIKTQNLKKFRDLIGVELDVIGEDEESLQFYLDKIGSYYARYVKSNTPQITLTDEYDKLGRRKVNILFYKGSDIENNTSEVILELFFGPPNIVALAKISDYNLVIRKIKEEATGPTTPQPPSNKNLNY